MKSRNLIIGTGALIAIGLLASAFSLKTKRTIPEGAHAVTPFDADKYLGTWYEIARFDFKFEKGLSKTTANYSLNDRRPSCAALFSSSLFLPSAPQTVDDT